MREAPWWRPALNVLNLSCLILSSYKVLGILSHKNRSQQLSCNFFSCRWILLLQRILDDATLQPCRSLDHLQKDNKNLQGPGQRTQNETLNNYQSLKSFSWMSFEIYKTTIMRQWTSTSDLFRISTGEKLIITNSFTQACVSIGSVNFVHLLKIEITQKHTIVWGHLEPLIFKRSFKKRS